MNNQMLIIYNHSKLYQIFEEISSELNFEIIEISSEKLLNDKIKNLDNFLVLTNVKLNVQNEIVIYDFPIKIFKLLEKININFLKSKFSNQSKILINQYYFDLNSREMIKNNNKLKLTEKEINTIVYLSKAPNPVSVEKLEELVWNYQSDIETHTVETHIYRLRKKILKFFNDDKFIISERNGYKIK